MKLWFLCNQDRVSQVTSFDPASRQHSSRSLFWAPELGRAYVYVPHSSLSYTQPITYKFLILRLLNYS